jgi:hypothetical protein
MTAAHLDEEPASERDTEKLLNQNPGLVAFLREQPEISRQYQDPYLGGIGKSGKPVYITNDVPETLPRTGIRPDFYIALHERSEWWIMTVLGMDYLGEDGTDGAHHFATRIEHWALEVSPILVNLGIIPPDLPKYDPDEYEDELAGYIRKDEAEEVTPDTVPPDLFTGPYEDDETPFDEKLIPVFRAAEAMARGEKVDHETVHYGRGHKPEFCRTCRFSTVNGEECRFVKLIDPAGWCLLWRDDAE